jgi:pimeloyl-ACP methyl ester carboxylesterase
VPGLGDWLIERMRRQAVSPSGLRRFVYDQRLLTPEFIRQSQAASYEFVRVMRRMMVAELPQAQTPTCPTLVLWGERDRWAPLANGRRLKAQIPGAFFQTIPQAGHLPQIEQPAACRDAIRRFCFQDPRQR